MRRSGRVARRGPSAPGPVARLLLAVVLVLAGSAPVAAQDLVARLRAAAPAIDPKVLALALEATECAVSGGVAARPERLAVIDYTRPSTARRLWLFDLDKGSLLKHDYVAHGRGSGGNVPTRFSNVEGSYQSSIGLFAGAETYRGNNGYSLRLDGLEPGINDQARRRAIVIHGADYVDASWVARQGRIGRSHGCPAVPQHAIHSVVDNLKGGQFLFAYYPDEQWIQTSAYLNCAADGARGLLTADTRQAGAGSL